VVILKNWMYKFLFVSNLTDLVASISQAVLILGKKFLTRSVVECIESVGCAGNSEHGKCSFILCIFGHS